MKIVHFDEGKYGYSFQAVGYRGRRYMVTVDKQSLCERYCFSERRMSNDPKLGTFFTQVRSPKPLQLAIRAWLMSNQVRKRPYSEAA